MNQISSIATSNYIQYQTSLKTTGNQHIKSENNDKKLTIEITPGERNVTEGDKSGNTAQIRVQGPNNEFRTEVSREQLMNGLEKRFYQKALDQKVIGNKPLINLVAASELLDNETVGAVVQGRQKQNNINTYINSTNQSKSENDASKANSYQMSIATRKYIEYQNQMIKQELIFSHVNRSSLNVKA